ncbi:MAG TPA: hypothetical protein VGM23_04005, partial [Armatimonadota bacterium]
MFTKRRLPLILFLALALFGAALWQFGILRWVDGLTAGEWVIMARRAATSITYHAEGTSVTGGMQAGFTLDQGRQGCYLMRLTDARGRRCSLGCDGTQTWYQTGQKSGQAPSTETAVIPAHGFARILGTATVAGRATVRVLLQDGQTRKALSIDRETGVILAMTTIFRHREISRMRLDTIDYRRNIVIPRCQIASPTGLRAVTPEALSKLLGRSIIRPRWLPDGFKPRGTYLTTCDCCQGPLAVIRYADGMNALTLFEMHGMTCDMGDGCKIAPTGSALVATRRV